MKRWCLTQSSSMRLIRIIVALALMASVLIVMVPSTTAAPDAPSVEWSRTYDNLQALSVVQTVDGGYAITGIASSYGSSTLIKTDSSGNVQWQKTVGNAVSVTQTSDSGYVVFCQNGDVVKTDADGNILSSFSVGAVNAQLPSGSQTTGVQKGIIASDGTYIIVGNSVNEGGNLYAWLRRVDSQGNILWDYNYTSGPYVTSVVDTVDRGYVFGGNLQNNFWLAKLDSNGNQQWSQTFTKDDITDAHFVYAITATKDGGYMLAGVGEQTSGGMVPWLLKTDSQGHELWSIPYRQYVDDSFSAIVQTSDEGYLVYQPGNVMLTRTDSSGSELWTLTVGNGASNYRSSCLIQAKDGGYVIAGAALGNASFVTKISPEPDVQPPVVAVSNPVNKTYETGDIQLVFTVNEPVSWMGYSLDGQDNVTIMGNTTLSGLALGAHNLTISAQDLTGLMGVSRTVQFTIVARFPIELVIGGIAVATAVSIGFLLYFKRNSLSAYKKKGLTSLFTKQRLVTVANSKLVWTLIIISLSILLVFAQIFFPYFYYSSSSGNSRSHFEVGISYVYEQDSAGQIYSEVSHIKDMGFSVIRVNLVCDSISPSAYSNTLTDTFFSAVRQLGIKVALIINNHDSSNNINYYLGKWGEYLTYVQVLNEPDVATSWDMGALFTDDEAGSRFEEIYGIVEQHQLSVQYYTNFGPAFLLRTNLPIQFSEKLDFVGFDVFMESFLTLSPRMIQLLQKITNKEIVIAEFGMSSNDDTAQSDYIIKGLNLFKSMGLRGCWIVYWNSIGNSYGIRGRLAEQKVGEWIAQNT